MLADHSSQALVLAIVLWDSYVKYFSLSNKQLFPNAMSV